MFIIQMWFSTACLAFPHSDSSFLSYKNQISGRSRAVKGWMPFACLLPAPHCAFSGLCCLPRILDTMGSALGRGGMHFFPKGCHLFASLVHFLGWLENQMPTGQQSLAAILLSMCILRNQPSRDSAWRGLWQPRQETPKLISLGVCPPHSLYPGWSCSGTAGFKKAGERSKLTSEPPKQVISLMGCLKPQTRLEAISTGLPLSVCLSIPLGPHLSLLTISLNDAVLGSICWDLGQQVSCSLLGRIWSLLCKIYNSLLGFYLKMYLGTLYTVSGAMITIHIFNYSQVRDQGWFPY